MMKLGPNLGKLQTTNIPRKTISILRKTKVKVFGNLKTNKQTILILRSARLYSRLERGNHVIGYKIQKWKLMKCVTKCKNRNGQNGLQSVKIKMDEKCYKLLKGRQKGTKKINH